MAKAKTKAISPSISGDEHAALLMAESRASLTQAHLAHANTRRQLQQAMAELALMRAQEAARKAAESACGDVKDAVAQADGAMKTLSDLTQSIRKTHNLSEHHAIDSMTGAILSPEAAK